MPVAYLAIVRQECRTSYQFLLNAQIHVAHSIKQAGELAVSVYPLAFPAHAFKVDADDFRAVEGLFGIFQAGS